jgi:CRISPR/Cas system-associated protein endoribonuclease Cas2
MSARVMRVLALFEVPFVTLFEADFPFRFRRAVVGSGKRKWERDGRQILTG